MRVQLVAVGSKMPTWVQQGYEEYAKRLPKELLPKLVELNLGMRGKNSAVKEAVEQEGQQMLAAIPDSHHVVALDVKGKSWSTEDLAQQLEGWRMSGRDVSLLIGGPDGLAESCLARAQQRWSLSPLTLPHPLVRVVLIEQLYRAWTILQNHPYHK
jgi:23S rRNA (pseudouridine1915-N3)-methyltransferase